MLQSTFHGETVPGAHWEGVCESFRALQGTMEAKNIITVSEGI
jgi:hypothetical protein